MSNKPSTQATTKTTNDKSAEFTLTIRSLIRSESSKPAAAGEMEFTFRSIL